MNLGRQQGRKGRQLGCLSNSCNWVIRGGGSWIGVCQENSCPDVGESVPHLTYGFLPVAGAGRLCWCLVEGRGCIFVTCKHVGVGMEVGVLSGCSQQGIMPAFTSSKNQDWNFPEAHFLPFNPQPRTTAAKSVPTGQTLSVGEEQNPPGGPPCPVHPSTQKPFF